MSGLRISEALIFCSIRSLYAYLRHALCLGRCLPTTVAVAPQSWVMDISAPPGLSLCDVCMVLRWGVAVCACVVVVGQCVCGWIGVWRFMFVERVGEMGLCAYLWHALCLGLVYPRPSLRSSVVGYGYISPQGLRCVMSAWCCGGVLRCVPVWLLWGNVRGWSGGGGSCLWSELAR